MNTRWLLIVSAVLAWLFGLMLLFDAHGFEAPIGIDITDKVATIAQAQGAILVGLGLINWLSRGVTEVHALTAVLAGNLVVQVLSFAVAARAFLLHLFPIQGGPALVIHVILGAAFAVALAQVRRTAAPSTAQSAA